MTKLEGGHMHTIRKSKTRATRIHMELCGEEHVVRDERTRTARAIDAFWNKRGGAPLMRVVNGEI